VFDAQNNRFVVKSNRRFKRELAGLLREMESLPDEAVDERKRTVARGVGPLN
jgi:hypothetical protein